MKDSDKIQELAKALLHVLEDPEILKAVPAESLFYVRWIARGES